MGGAQADDLPAPPSRLTALCPRTRPSFGEGLPGRTAKAIIKIVSSSGRELGRAREGNRVARVGKAGDVGEVTPTLQRCMRTSRRVESRRALRLPES